MTPTPTASDRPQGPQGFPTLAAALDYAAGEPTGFNLHDLRGRLEHAVPYATLRQEARRLARGLLASGFSPGDRIGLIAETDLDFLLAFFACQYAGLVPAPLPLPAPLAGREAYVEQIGRLLASAKAATVFGPEPLLPWLADAARAAGGRPPRPLSEIPRLDEGELPAIGPDDPCYVQFSSGSTRTPTGVLATHRAAMANAIAITRDGLGITPPDRALSWLPLYHDMGLVGFVIAPLCQQMSIDLLPTGAFVRRPLLWLELMTRNRATISFAPTFGFDLCARRAETADLSPYDLSAWRAAGIGGDMVRPGPLNAFAERFAACGFDGRAFMPCYGMAEATLALSMAPMNTGLELESIDVDLMEASGLVQAPGPSARSRAFARCGAPLPLHELEVRGEDGRPLPERRVGRIFARGPSLMRGYLFAPEATAAVLSADGWLDTGDLGYMSQGQIVPTGRAKDLILLNGRNIWPQDLEWTAEAEVDRLRSGDVAAFEGGEEELVVLVQCRSSDPAVRAALVEEVIAVLRARHGVEARVELVGAHALPQTSSGKLSRSRARSLYLSGAFKPVETV